MNGRSDMRGPGGGGALGKVAIILGVLSWMIAPEAVSHTAIDSVSQAAVPATLMSLMLLAVVLEKLK